MSYDKIIKLLKPITSDGDLRQLCKLLRIKLDGIYDLLELNGPLPKKGSYIILLRQDGGIGHWVAIHNNEYFDPTGVSEPTIFGQLKHFDKQVQGSYEDWCGIWVILFLYARQNNKPELLNGYEDLDIDI